MSSKYGQVHAVVQSRSSNGPHSADCWTTVIIQKYRRKEQFSVSCHCHSLPVIVSLLQKAIVVFCTYAFTLCDKWDALMPFWVLCYFFCLFFLFLLFVYKKQICEFFQMFSSFITSTFYIFFLLHLDNIALKNVISHIKSLPFMYIFHLHKLTHTQECVVVVLTRTQGGHIQAWGTWGRWLLQRTSWWELEDRPRNRGGRSLLVKPDSFRSDGSLFPRLFQFLIHQMKFEISLKRHCMWHSKKK